MPKEKKIKKNTADPEIPYRIAYIRGLSAGLRADGKHSNPYNTATEPMQYSRWENGWEEGKRRLEDAATKARGS